MIRSQAAHIAIARKSTQSSRTGTLRPCLGAERAQRLLTPPSQPPTRTGRFAGLLSLHRALQIRAGIDRQPVLIDAGVLDRVGGSTRKHLSRSTCVVISDRNVARLFADRVKRSLTSAGFRSALIIIPAGEKSKTLEQVGAICDRMIAAALDRTSFVVGLGGGMIGDISGFVAAIYHRGIPHVQFQPRCWRWWTARLVGKPEWTRALGRI